MNTRSRLNYTQTHNACLALVRYGKLLLILHKASQNWCGLNTRSTHTSQQSIVCSQKLRSTPIHQFSSAKKSHIGVVVNLVKKMPKIVSTVTDSRDDQLMLEKTPFESHKMKHITTSKYRERAEEKRQERKEGKGMTEFHHYLFHNFTAADCG